MVFFFELKFVIKRTSVDYALNAAKEKKRLFIAIALF